MKRAMTYCILTVRLLGLLIAVILCIPLMMACPMLAVHFRGMADELAHAMREYERG
jgi:hypothetical protein